jgi:nitrate reductase NapAB chaperone NapD
MAKPSNLQLRAVLLTLLLAGCEGARIESGVEFMGTLDHEVDKEIRLDAAAGALFQVRGRSPVCGDMTDEAAALQRYKNKCAKVMALSAVVLRKNCLATCPLTLRSIKTRLAEFQSCNAALSEAGKVPSQLKSVMEGSTDESIQSTMTQVSTDMMMLLKKNNMFQKIGDCEFNPQGFDAKKAEVAGDMTEVRKSIFGDDCGSQQAVNTYIKSLPGTEQKAVNNFMEKIQKMMQTIQHAKESGETLAQEIKDLESDMEDLGSSLLEFDSEGALEDAEGLAPVIIVFIVLIVVGFLLTWWAAEMAGNIR